MALLTVGAGVLALASSDGGRHVGADLERDRRLLGFLLLPLGLVIAAAMARKYPASGRLILWLAPAIILLISLGIDYLWNHLRGRAILLIYIVFFQLTWPSAGYLFKSRSGGEEIRQVLGYVEARYQPQTDFFYIYHAAPPPVEYYKRKFARLKSLDVGRNACIGRVGQGDWNIFFEDIRNADQQRQQKGYQRMWLIFSHVWTWNDVDEQRLIVTIAGRHAKIIDKVQAPGAAAYLLEPMANSPATQTSH